MKKSLLIISALVCFGCTPTVDSTPQVSPSATVAPSVVPISVATPTPSEATPTPTASSVNTDTPVVPVATPSVDTTGNVQFVTVKAILDNRCVTCHSASRPSSGVALDTFESIKSNLSGIRSQSVNRTSMPPRNSTGMTTEERKSLGDWISQGANN